MATAYSGTGNGYRLRLDYNQVNPQNIPGNYSTASYALYLENGTRTFSANSNGGLTVNGVGVWGVAGTVTQLSTNSSLLLHSGSMNVGHNADGTKSISLSASFQTVNQSQIWSVPPLSVSATLTFDRIPRGPKVEQSGAWANTIAYAEVSGNWQQCLVYAEVSGGWQQVGG